MRKVLCIVLSLNFFSPSIFAEEAKTDKASKTVTQTKPKIKAVNKSVKPTTKPVEVKSAPVTLLPNDIHTCGIQPRNKTVLTAFYYFGNRIVTPAILDKYKESIAHLDVLNYSVAGINDESIVKLGEITAQNIYTIQKWMHDNKMQTKLVLSIGHWAAKNSLKIFTNPTIRKKFIDSVIVLLKNPSYNLKGVDIDWENIFEEGAGGVAQFASMITDLRAGFDKAGLHNACLSVDLPVGVKFAKIYPAPLGWAPAVNWANLMAYAFYGEPHYTELDGVLGNVGTRYAGKMPSYATVSISTTLDYYTMHGLPKNKVLVGLPYYALGNYIRNASAPNFGLREPILPRSPLIILSYSTVADRFGTFEHPKRPGAIHQITFTAPSNVAGTSAYWVTDFLVESKELGKTYEFISYPDPAAIRQTAQFVLKNGYLGFSAWQLTDDLPFTQSNSILRTLYETVQPKQVAK